MNNVRLLICGMFFIGSLFTVNVSESFAGNPNAEWAKNHKFASLTIYVKSNRDDIPIGGTRIRIRRQARAKRNFKRNTDHGPMSAWYEVIERTNSSGKLVITDWKALTGSGRAHKAVVKKTSPRPWRYLEIEVSATDFHSVNETAWVSFWEPDPSCYVYLSPR